MLFAFYILIESESCHCDNQTQHRYLRLVCTEETPVALVSEFWETVVDKGACVCVCVCVCLRVYPSTFALVLLRVLAVIEPPTREQHSV